MNSKSLPRVVRPSGSQYLPLLRPMEIGELLDEAFDLYKRNFRLFFGITVVLYLPLGVLAVAVPNDPGWLVVQYVAGSVAGAITTGALVFAALERLLGRHTTIAAAYRFGLRRCLRLISAEIVAGLAMSAGLILFIVPGIIVSLWFMLMAPVVVVENRGGVGALERARKIAAGNLWRIFFVGLGLLFVILIFVLVLITLAGLIGAMTGMQAGAAPDRSNPAALLLQAGTTMILMLFQSAWTPVFAAAQLMLYIDLRIRREAYDIELLTEAVEERVQAAKGPASLLTPLPGQAGG
jgi:hypothetical protein